MKRLLNIMRLPQGSDPRLARAHTIWLAISLTAMGCCIGGLGLFYAATAYTKLNSLAILYSYLTHPVILALNLLPAVALIWLGYFLFRRAWAGFLLSFLPIVGISMVNYFKIRLRSDPLLATDLRLAAEAGGIVGGYTLDITWLTWFTVFCFVAGLLFTIFLMPSGLRDWKNRAFGTLSCLALMGVAFYSWYLSPTLYQNTANNRFINQWSDVEVFVSKGCVYPFLYSFQEMFPTPPEGYNEGNAQTLLSAFADQDIPAEKKVSVMGIMLEAFCDLTDLPVLGEHEAVVRAYEPWHQLEDQVENGPCFSFAVSYQNHGPYETTFTSAVEHLTPTNSGLSQESCNIWNNYLNGVADTMDAMVWLTEELESMEEPVVLVLFGDHKPWGGNGNSGYRELGVTFDLSTTEGFYDYYSTPYLIWANSAAKEVLGNDFVGDGGDFSPAFLMTELFNQCGWEGPAFMQLSRQMREITPMVHGQDLYLVDGAVTDTLEPEDSNFLQAFLGAQYYRENKVVPGA